MVRKVNLGTLDNIISNGSHGTSNKALERFRNIPFMCRYEQVEHSGLNCCFNHIINLPVKNGITHPLYQYEKDIIDYLETDNPDDIKNKHLSILKSSSLGITTLFLRYIGYRCLVNDDWKNKRVSIITGPRLDLSLDLIARLRRLFEEKDIIRFAEKNTTCTIANTKVEAFPSHLGLHSMRGLVDISMIMFDEFAFVPISQAMEARAICERNIAKSNPYLVLVTTPWKVNDCAYLLKQEPEESCIYKRLYLNYEVGLQVGIFSQREIDLVRPSPSFETEYNLKWGYAGGNVFSTLDIEAAIQDAYSLDQNIIQSGYNRTYIGVDPGFGSSQLGVVAVQFTDKVEVIFAESYERILWPEAINMLQNMVYRIKPSKLYIDGSNAAMVKELMHLYQPSLVDYHLLKPEYIESWITGPARSPLIVPINFQKKHQKMLQNTAKVLSHQGLRIDKRFDKLLTSLRTATSKGIWDLDKQNTEYDDILDALQLALLNVKWS